ncbi:MAG: FkbM family methyltransferase [Geminicoccales bacterium]
MSIAELAPIFEGPDKWPRAYGLLRSLVIYYGQPWRTAGLKELYRPFISPGDLAFDIGAHVGNRSRCWANLGAKVVAIEPQADLATWLRYQFKNRDEILVVETALAGEPGLASMHVSPTNPTVTTLSDDWIDNVTKTDGFKDVAWQAPVEVKVTTLDRLIDTHGLPVFCKIDVEGYEAEVLKGLSQPIKALSIEFLPAVIEVALEAVDLLESLGRYQYNVSFGEGMAFDRPDWQSADQMRHWLTQQRGGQRSGDVYARLES